MPCDVTKPNLLLPEDIGQFDVVTGQLVLESGCYTLDSYGDAVKTISQIVRPGGHLIMASVFESSHYMLDGKTFFSLPVTQSFVEDVLSANSFEGISFETKVIASTPCEKTFFILHAVK